MKSPNDSPRPHNNSPAGADLSAVVAACKHSEGFLPALGELLNCAGDELLTVGATCKGGGACCKFDLAGHRLYISAGELALLATRRPDDPDRAALRRCPWQSGPRCTAHARRPLGCRTYFCDRPTENTCREIYERYHSAIRSLHEGNSLAYIYVELTGACEELYRADGHNRAK